MSIFGAMFSGVSGLNAQSQALGMISDNISNVNTVGYKGSRAHFSTLVTSNATSSSFSPGGVRSNPFQMVEQQGLLQASASSTDVAIVGGGFFVVNESSTPAVGDEYLFTRAGSFNPDANGFLRNTAGFYLQGWPTDSLGVPTVPNTSVVTSLQPVNVSGVSGSAVATGNIAVGANLPSTDAVGATHDITVQTFDSLGVAHDVRYTFTKSAANQWNLTTTAPVGAANVVLNDSANAVSAAAGRLDFTAQPADGDTIVIDGVTYEFDNNASVVDNAGVLRGVTIGASLSATVADVVTNWLLENAADTRLVQGSGTETGTLFFSQSAAGAAVAFNAANTGAITQSSVGAFTVPATAAATPSITFDGTGRPSAINVASSTVVYSNGAAAGSYNVDLGTIGQADGMTQFANSFATFFINQDGVTFGTFSGVIIGEDGVVNALFDNGQSRPIFKIPVATFTNPNGLLSRSGNVFSESDTSGNVLLNNAGVGGGGRIANGALEASTVDIANEFTNMIITQQAYSASARIITTADEMLDEVLRIAR